LTITIRQLSSVKFLNSPNSLKFGEPHGAMAIRVYSKPIIINIVDLILRIGEA